MEYTQESLEEYSVSLSRDAFTEMALKAIESSHEIQRRYQHSQWDVEHILLALIKQEHGLTQQIIGVLGAQLEKLTIPIELTSIISISTYFFTS